MENKDIYEKFTGKALAYLEDTELFLKEQIPDFFQQVITYNLLSASIWILISLVIIVTCCLLIKSSLLKKDKYGLIEEKSVCVIVISILLVIISIIPIGFNIEKALKAYFAPKVFIVDYLRKQ